MAKRRDVIAEDCIRDVYYNKWGEKVLEVSRTTREIQDGDKEISETIAEHRETLDGEMVDAPSANQQGKGQTAMRTCDVCAKRRRPSARRSKRPTMTMSQASPMKRCRNCKRNLCQNHHHISPYDKQPRCLRCHLGHYLYKWIVEPMLWKRIKRSAG